MTSGVDGIYPKGYIGRYRREVDKRPGLYRVISVRPTVDFTSLEEVLVVLVPAAAPHWLRTSRGEKPPAAGRRSK